MTRMINSAFEHIVWPFRRLDHCSEKGFTLAELLIAIAIFALLVSIVMGSFKGVFLSTEALTIQRTNNAMARACLDRMTIDLQNIHVDLPPLFKPTDMAETPPDHRFAAGGALDAASPVLLQFASKAHVAAHPNHVVEIAIIRYYLEPQGGTEDSVFRLRRADTLLLGDTLPELGADPVLCENIKAMQIICIDADSGPHETWDSDASDQDYATPRAVAIRLELISPSGSDIYETTVFFPVWRDAGDVE